MKSADVRLRISLVMRMIIAAKTCAGILIGALIALAAPSSMAAQQGKGTAAKLNSDSRAALGKLYAFIFSQKGLMGGLGLQGNKITQIKPK